MSECVREWKRNESQAELQCVLVSICAWPRAGKTDRLCSTFLVDEEPRAVPFPMPPTI